MWMSDVGQQQKLLQPGLIKSWIYFIVAEACFFWQCHRIGIDKAFPFHLTTQTCICRIPTRKGQTFDLLNWDRIGGCLSHLVSCPRQLNKWQCHSISGWVSRVGHNFEDCREGQVIKAADYVQDLKDPILHISGTFVDIVNLFSHP